MGSSRRNSIMLGRLSMNHESKEPLIENPDAAFSLASPRRRAFLIRLSLGITFVVILTVLMGIISPSMTRPHVSVKGSPPTVNGLNSVPTTVAESVNTVVNNGVTKTYRAIPTLPSDIDETPPVLANIYDPQAVDAQNVCPGYIASRVVVDDYGLTAALTLRGRNCNAYGIDIIDLNLTVAYQSVNRLSVRITPTYVDPSNYSDYLIQPWYVTQPTPEHGASSSSTSNDLQFVWSNSPSFNFGVIRKSTGDVIFSTTGSKLVFEDQFVEFKTVLPPDWNLQGLGETIHTLRLLNNHNITIYATDSGDPIDRNIYGSHPFYLDTRYYELDTTLGTVAGPAGSGEHNASTDYISYAHGVYLRNAHGQEILLRDTALTWRTIGGSIDLYFFSGPSPAEVTMQYIKAAAGLPAMQSYWTFGYHQCRWGYSNWTELMDVVTNFRRFDIPLETIWTDMNQYRNFDNDMNTFSYTEGQQFLSGLHSTHQHYVPIVDSAIYVPNPTNTSDAYEPFNRGNQSGVFMLNSDESLYIGAVWPGSLPSRFTSFPDWRAPGTQAWWTNELKTWHELVSYDGIWIDMSEVSSFCVGSCGTGRLSENPVHPPFGLAGEENAIIYSYPEGFDVTNATEYASASSASVRQASRTASSSLVTTTGSLTSSSTSYLRTTPTPGIRNLDFPPYALNNVVGALPVHVMSPNAVHADGATDYSIHNLYGAEILNATYNALSSVFPGKRPFIVGRSTFVGSGMQSAHWGGDNASKFLYMAMSIPQALQMSLFGIPMFGVDTCGFDGQTSEELCNRWMQLSSFFPFFRNHNVLSANSQEPYVWASVAEATKIAMNIRYSLLPYLYTLFYQAHTTGSTVMRALAWEFPQDPSLADVDRQFMLGGSLLITPVLTPLAKTVNGVFPGWKQDVIWYDWYTRTALPNSKGANVTIPAPLGHIPVYVRGGSILPMQQPGYTTTESRRNPWSLLVALDAKGTATGQLYVDDGESVAPNATLHVDFTLSENSLDVSTRGSYSDTNALANITVMGLARAPTNVLFNGGSAWAGGVAWEGSDMVAVFSGFHDVTAAGAWSNDWTLTWSH